MLDYEGIYADIARRTGGDIYLGVVGPVRTGKSTFIKRFMELMVLPALGDSAAAQRARDELPQSAAGRTIMTTEPKFIPEQAVQITLDGGATFRTRLIDCVGYMVTGAMGHEENEQPRMVKSPWFDREVPFDLAAETGTRRVMEQHATIGVVVTTDGSISGIDRSAYENAEQEVVRELQTLAKPFVILLNCSDPTDRQSLALAQHLSEEYGQIVLPINCAEMTQESVAAVLKMVLYAFPVREIAVALPAWVTKLEQSHPLRVQLEQTLTQYAASCSTMQDVAGGVPLPECEVCSGAAAEQVNLGTGCARVALQLQDGSFYRTLSELAGIQIEDEASLMPCVISLAGAKKRYEKVQAALEQAEATGYGIVMPDMDQLQLEEPEIVRQGGRYGVRLRASAPSIHMMRATISTEVAPIVGSEKQSEALVDSLLANFEEDPGKIWESNIFGKSLHELVNDGLQNKLMHMPPEAQLRIQETMERIINEGCSGLICIIL